MIVRRQPTYRSLRQPARRGAVMLHRASFTLVELMIVTAIITILASSVLFAMYGVVEQAKVARTKAQVAKLHELIMAKWQSYHTRALRVNMPPLPPPYRWPVLPEPFVDADNNGRWSTGETFTDHNGSGSYEGGLARVRLDILRDVMRMELPDRITDLTDGPTVIALPPIPVLPAPPAPAIWKSYRRRAGFVGNVPPPNWSTTYQGAECLYLIVASIREGDSSGLDYFKSSEIGDVDGDGMFEILDAWGKPIEFLRWPAGYESEVQPLDHNVSYDAFDPHHVDTRPTYRLIPLIYSAGPDGVYDIVTDSPTAIRYQMTDPTNDPYHSWDSGASLVGMRYDIDGDGLNDADNITNHLLDTN